MTRHRLLIALLILVMVPVVVLGHGDAGQSNHGASDESNVEIEAEMSRSETAGASNEAPDFASVSGKNADAPDHDEHDHSPDWVERLLPGLTGAKNLHPMFVHFPIVFFWTAMVFVGLSWFFRPVQFLRFSRWMFWLGLGSLPITAATGFWAVGGWGGGHLTGHRNLMLITVGLAAVLFVLLRLLPEQRSLHRVVLSVGLLVIVLVMSFGADRGAWLVYVKGSGVQTVEHQHSN